MFRIAAFVFLAALTIAALVKVLFFNYTEMLNAATAMGNLAVVPENASEFQIDTAGSPFTRTFNFKFKCTPKLIEEYISKSPAFDGQTPIKLGGKQPHLPYSQFDIKRLDSDEDFKPEYYLPSATMLWFAPTISSEGHGRKYKIPPYDGHVGGYLIIDDDTNTVYVHVAHS